MLFFGLLLGLPIAQQWVQSEALAVFDSFSGSALWYSVEAMSFFLSCKRKSYLQVGSPMSSSWRVGAAQAVPGPLFTFAAYLGAVMRPLGGGWPARLWRLSPCSPRPFSSSWVRCRYGTRCGRVPVFSRPCGASMRPWSGCSWPPSIIRYGRVQFTLLWMARRACRFRTPGFLEVAPWLVVMLSALGGAVLARL